MGFWGLGFFYFTKFRVSNTKRKERETTEAKERERERQQRVENSGTTRHNIDTKSTTITTKWILAIGPTIRK
jgi:hypothetical protein